MRVLPIDQPGAIDEAARVLRDGGLVAFPTDTVYGVAALAASTQACARLFAAKGRPSERAIPIFVPSFDALPVVAAEIGEDARRLAAAGWPGPLTLVLRRAPSFESAALAGGDTVAVRVPDYAPVLALVRACGEPLAVTSANRSGGPNPTTAAQVAEGIGASLDLLLDGGPCASDVPSTVVDVTADTPRILRAGAMSREAVERALGKRVG